MSREVMDDFIQTMHTRFACKKYENKPIPKKTLEFILEVGRLSPTSFGLEGWAFHVVQSPLLRKQLTKACFDQESVATAPVTMIITALTASSYKPTGSFVTQRGVRFPGTLDEFVADYEGYYYFLKKEGRIDCWSRAQCYIAAANMMTAAATETIQSCAIEGFDEDQVAKIINLEQHTWQVSLLITFGYPAEPVREKIREPLANLVTYY